MKRSILSLDDVSYVYKNRYQTVQAVKNVSCAFQQGKVYALVGKSGSGKTAWTGTGTAGRMWR